MPAFQFHDRTVGDILVDIRDNSATHYEQGARFEELFRRAAPQIPDLEVEKIWRWRDWPGLARHGFSAQDIGIDLVAETTAGAQVAIQCKCFAEDHRVGRDDIKNFVAAEIRERKT